MEPYSTDRSDESPIEQTSENAGELHSRSKLHGSKSRDFSVSRREYRAHLRHRAAQQICEQALLAKADAEAAATAADLAARQAEEAARFKRSDTSVQRSLLEAEEAFRTAVAERLEADRRAEIAVAAEAAARREQREIAAAQQFSRQSYTDSERRRISLTLLQAASRGQEANDSPLPVGQERRVSVSQSGLHHHIHGSNDASGVRQIYRTPGGGMLKDNFHTAEPEPPSDRAQSRQPAPIERLHSTAGEGQPSTIGQRRADSMPPSSTPPSEVRTTESTDRPPQRRSIDRRAAPPSQPSTVRPLSPFSQTPAQPDSGPRRRAQDRCENHAPGAAELPRPVAPEPSPKTDAVSPEQVPSLADPAGPSWIYAPSSAQIPPDLSIPQRSVADTLQSSRERVAARWFALKGVFEQPDQEEIEAAAPVRQKETRTPVLAVFSLAGGVGKTSLVATVGRALSSMGEKVLLTDTVSHGLLPFYFGASELRQGTVRTFLPPSGSTDAPVYLIGYDAEQKGSDEAARELLIEEIVNSSQGTHRILLDLSSNSSWIVRQMARMNPTVLVPLAPDMNSVISLQFVEKFFHGIPDGDGRPLQPFFVLNQFDASLPLHLDVREVLRRQLGDRLLPFVIRRAPSISEALAEGMTIVDYAPDTPVTEDYLNVATWLRSIAAPVAAGFRNVRWSEHQAIDSGL